ncbi:hypothetical protein [Sphingomonas sp. CARO-RG-8B-R24-01]|uniref:hypothetical protein n=1 Tax=Sphingomonas sp. CARO-RG-8B-R24-01 TaxID=2914831 RepID=UPI001F585622|nr:hypothetical protein [Sphingomonas sp. CARO-RG-8B-R24-01]
MLPAIRRFEHNDRQLVARVLEERARRDRIDPLWIRKRLDQLRAGRGAVRHG